VCGILPRQCIPWTYLDPLFPIDLKQKKKKKKKKKKEEEKEEEWEEEVLGSNPVNSWKVRKTMCDFYIMIK
jgi:hypothetical protein